MKLQTNNLNLSAALRYAELGLKIIPIHVAVASGCGCGDKSCNSPGKHPVGSLVNNGFLGATSDQQKIRRWWSRSRPAWNIGMVCGGVVDILDVDPRSGGADSFCSLIAEAGLDESDLSTLSVKSGGSGRHWWFRSDPELSRKIKSLPGLDILGRGGYCLLPPSNHHTGGHYEFTGDDPLIDEGVQKIEELLGDWPPELKRLIIDTSSASTSTSTNAGGTGLRSPRNTLRLQDAPLIPEGGRANYLASKAGALQRSGLTVESITAALEIENQRCDPPLESSAVAGIAQSISQYPSDPYAKIIPSTDDTPLGPEDLRPFTPLGNSLRLLDRYGDELKYCPSLAKNREPHGWLLWNGQCWDVANDSWLSIFEMAKATNAAIATDEKGLVFKPGKPAGAPPVDVAVEWSHRGARDSNYAEMVRLLCSDPDLRVTVDELDRRQWLLNCTNGTVNLKGWAPDVPLGEHNRDDLLTLLCGVAYDPAAECPVWDQTLREVFQENTEVIEYFQRTIGYALTGDMSEQVMTFLYGIGSNGKTTLIKHLKQILGGYATESVSDTFISKRDAGIRNDLAMLRNKRLVVTSETDADVYIDEPLIKVVTDGTPIQARYLHKEYFEYSPRFSLLMLTNHPPRIKGQDPGILRRIRIIPFRERFGAPGHPPIRQNLDSLLSSEYSGILNWALRGCALWQQQGLAPPSDVLYAAEEFKELNDPLLDFVESCVTEDPDETLPVRDLYDCYRGWSQAHTDIRSVLGKRKFTEKFIEKGFEQGRSKQQRFWVGLQLNDLARHYLTGHREHESKKIMFTGTH